MRELDSAGGFASAYSDSVMLHDIFSSLILLPYIANLYTLFTYSKYVSLKHRMMMITPITVFFLSVSFLGGVSILAMRGFYIDFKVLLMIFGFCVFAMGEVVRLKKSKLAFTSRDYMLSYIRFCRVMYLLFASIHLIMMVVFKVVD